MREIQETLDKIRKIADYQFGNGAGATLFPDSVKISLSRATGRIRHIYLKGKLLATLRPRDSMFSITVEGGKRLVRVKSEGHWVKVSPDAALFVSEGKSVFSKHVIDADQNIRPQEEVVVLNRNDQVVAVGKAILTGREMKQFKKGLAVRVRRGAAEALT